MHYVLNGAALRRRREAKGLSQAQLAARIGRHEKTLTDYERGAADPRVFVLGRLCEVLDCNPNDLLVGIDEVAS